RRETRCITRRPLTNTKRNQHRLHIKILPVEKLFCLSMPALHRIMRIMTEASRLLDIPRFSPYHPVSKQHTSQRLQLGDNDSPRLGECGCSKQLCQVMKQVLKLI
ncbi:hypothetical protein, partial [Bifidobacterium asteroides]|uniref:hypothetical protein n=1 Tax=Bifidobacterium asteroides TaxID=1684 RepID=UPI0019D33850